METLENALYLIPQNLGENPCGDMIPPFNREIIRGIKDFIVESRKSAVRFLLKTVPEKNIDECAFRELNEHTDLNEISDCLDPILKEKKPMGIISDAGCPCVADPGSAAVEMAHRKNIRVIPLSGPSSILLSLMASGFSGQSFAFNGYLPAKPNERESKLKQLENKAYRENQTQIFIETPYRNQKMFESILKTLKGETKLCVAKGITLPEELIKTKTVSEWKKTGFPGTEKIPSIFLIYR